MRRALSGGREMLVSDVDEKLHMISCEATCVYEECSKNPTLLDLRIPNVRFTEE